MKRPEEKGIRTFRQPCTAAESLVGGPAPAALPLFTHVTPALFAYRKARRHCLVFFNDPMWQQQPKTLSDPTLPTAKV